MGFASQTLIIIVSIGATALTLDLPYEFHFVVDWLSVWVKRLSIPLIYISVLIFLLHRTIAKNMYLLKRALDKTTGYYESFLYATSFGCCLAITIGFLGFPIEVFLDLFGGMTGLMISDPKPGDIGASSPPQPGAFVWPGEVLIAVIVVFLITQIWAICMYFCFISALNDIERTGKGLIVK